MFKTKKRLMLLVGAGLGLTACAGSAALPSDTVALVTPLSLGPPPIYALIGYRTELELSSEQIAALDEIAQELEEKNRPLVAELESSARRSRQGGQLIVRSEGEGVLEQIRENQTEAVRAVEDLLSEEQRREVCRLYGYADRDRSRATRGRGTRGRDAEIENRLVRPIEWLWCSADAPEQPVS